MQQEYLSRLSSGRLEADPSQLALVERFAELSKALSLKAPPKTLLRALFGLGTPEWKAAPTGLYIYGPVGTGKTMLMDLFFDNVKFQPKQRAHFHEFMADVHDRIAAARKSTPGDPIPKVGSAIARSARLLCFDELHITNIADAMILGRLFAQLFKDGVTVVSTSNSHPDDLYHNGLNRDLFLPFIAMVRENMEVVELAAAKDFRLQKLQGRRLYFTPADTHAKAELDASFTALTGLPRGRRRVLELKGRRLVVPEAAMGVARFTFDDLCEKPLGSLDYLRLAHTFHTVLIDNIPRLTPDRRNAARRFVNLIDTLYDCGVGLVASADAEPNELYTEGDNAVLFERTASRLFEMRSEAYLRARRRVSSADAEQTPPDLEPEA